MRYRKPQTFEIERSLCIQVTLIHERAERECKTHDWILEQLSDVRAKACALPQYRQHAVHVVSHTMLDVVHRKLEWRHKVGGKWYPSPLPNGLEYRDIEDSAHFWPGTDARFQAAQPEARATTKTPTARPEYRAQYSPRPKASFRTVTTFGPALLGTERLGCETSTLLGKWRIVDDQGKVIWRGRAHRSE